MEPEIKKKVLIIDDEPEIARMVKTSLEITGRYEVMTENKGANGLNAAKLFKPDLILLDILMPDLEGSEVAAQLKSEKSTQDIPIIFLTAVISKEEVEESKGFIGKYPFMAKPVKLNELIDNVERYIR